MYLSKSVRGHRALILAAGYALWLPRWSMADNFAAVHYDGKTDQLVVTMSYRGTNPNHEFSLKWGECRTDDAGNPAGATAEMLDDQWEDAAEADFEKTVRLSLSGLPCARPATVTLRSAPRFLYTLTVP